MTPSDDCVPEPVMAETPDSSRERSASSHLASTPLFSSVDREVLERFDTSAHRVYMRGGETLFRQGERADALYVITRGRLQIVVETTEGSSRIVDALGRGALIGEMALLLDDLRTATAIASRDSELVRIEKPDFDRLLAEHPSIALEMARMLGARLKRTTRAEGADSTRRTIAVLPVSPDVDGAEFCTRLIAGFGGARDQVCHITPAMADSLHPGAADADFDDPAGRGLLHWMSSLEDRHRYVVYQADSTRIAWTRRCFRESDTALLVARAGAEPQPGARELELTRPDGHRTPFELVLLHDAGARIANTARWLESRDVVRHHHVRAGVDADYRRLARFVAGRAVGLVLSGGGARGLAHIGVIKRLGENGVPIDMIAGASMGAIVSALYASGHDADAIATLTRHEYVERTDFDFTLPVVALNSAASSVRRMKRLFGDRGIEDLPIGYFCVSTNLSRAESLVHDRGPVWLAVRTSCSIPGLLPPVPHDGDLLIDGGLLNNLPADVMRQRGAGVVIGVDVTPGVDLRTSLEGKPSMSGWRLLWDRLRPSRRARVPSIVDILSRTALVGSVRDAARMQAHCDVHLAPAVEQFAMNDFRAIDVLIDAGYQAAADVRLVSAGAVSHDVSEADRKTTKT